MTDTSLDYPRVIRVIDDSSFIINVGTDLGFENGDKFLIFGPGDHIIDPINGNDLGMLEIVRGRARIAHAQSKMSTLVSDEYEITPGTKRVVKRRGGAMFQMGNVPTVEEIEEGEERRKRPLIVEVGDFAKPI